MNNISLIYTQCNHCLHTFLINLLTYQIDFWSTTVLAFKELLFYFAVALTYNIYVYINISYKALLYVKGLRFANI